METKTIRIWPSLFTIAFERKEENEEYVKYACGIAFKSPKDKHVKKVGKSLAIKRLEEKDKDFYFEYKKYKEVSVPFKVQILFKASEIAKKNDIKWLAGKDMTDIFWSIL